MMVGFYVSKYTFPQTWGVNAQLVILHEWHGQFPRSHLTAGGGRTARDSSRHHLWHENLRRPTQYKSVGAVGMTVLLSLPNAPVLAGVSLFKPLYQVYIPFKGQGTR